MKKVSENEMRTIKGGKKYYYTDSECVAYSTSSLKFSLHKLFCVLCRLKKTKSGSNKPGWKSYQL